jgi:pimeloyl-ACP methyl ester carboxylesterase
MGNARSGAGLEGCAGAPQNMVSVSTSEFLFDGHRLVYDEYGSGQRPIVLVPGLLLPRSMHRPLATELAEQGNHVYVLDPLGHGDSDRPPDMACYSMSLFAEQTLALMDHVGLDEAVIGGTSLGANVALETIVAAPERVRGAVIEMPVLDNALLGCALAFTPLLVATTFGAPLTRLGARLMRALPRTRWNLVNVGLDWASLDPTPSGAYLQGLFFGRIAPPRVLRKQIETRALILGHPRDPVHPFSDADALATELRNARMVRAGSIFEMRVRPERLTGEITRFVEECWQPPAVAPRARRNGRAATA